MIEEIGEIFYTLLVGYIGALELCYIAKHIYHLTHQCIFQESEESRLKGLEDIQEQLKRAVAESEENQYGGYQVMKDGILNNANYKADKEQELIQQHNEQEIRSIESPTNNDDDIKNKECAVEKIHEEIFENDHDTLQENSSMHLDKIEESSQKLQEEKIIQYENNKDESLKTNLETLQETKNENEISEIIEQENNIIDTIAKNNEISSSVLQKENNTQKRESKIEGRFNVTDLSELELKMSNEQNKNQVNEGKLSGSEMSEVVVNSSSAESKLDDINEININESSRFNVQAIENDNNLSEINFLSKSSNIESSDELQLIPVESSLIDSVPELMPDNYISNDGTNNSSSQNVINITDVNEVANEIEIQNDSINFNALKSIEVNEVEKEIEIQNDSINFDAGSQTHRTSLIDNADSESSIEDDEENSISSVIEKKIAVKEDDEQYKILLTEEEKEKVINSAVDDINFKDLSQILKSSDVIKSDIVEASLQDEVYNEDLVVEEEQRLQDKENYSNYDEDVVTGDYDSDTFSGRRLRRSPRIIEIDQYEERWKNEVNEQQKRNQSNESEALIATEKTIDYSSLTEKHISEITSDFIKEEQNAEEEVILSKRTRELESGRLVLNITKDIINEKQNPKPSIELPDESGPNTSSTDDLITPFTPSPSVLFTPSPSVMEGLSDFYDFNASINPSRSPTISRSTSVQSPLSTPDNQNSTPFSPVKSPSSLTPNAIPKNIEYLSDFYDFSVKLHKASYPEKLKKLSFENEIESENFVVENLINYEMVAGSKEEEMRETSPCFNYSFRELKVLSEMSFDSAIRYTDNIISKLDTSSPTGMIRPDSNFMRSQYVGASTDYSYDFEDLREEARNFIRSRSPSISFENDVIPISMEDYRNEIQNNILKELEQKSLKYESLEIDKELLEHARRESDSALVKNTEIVFQIQDELDFVGNQDKYSIVIENIEIEPEEYHHFRRFSLQQEIQVEEYPDNDYIYLDKETLDLMSSESFDNNQDNVVNLEKISLTSDETTDIILKKITENVTISLDEKIDEDNAENMESNENKTIKTILERDDLENVDLKYVPKKEYNWRKKFKIDDDDEKDVNKLKCENAEDENETNINDRFAKVEEKREQDVPNIVNQNDLNDENESVNHKALNNNAELNNNEAGKEAFTMIEQNEIQDINPIKEINLSVENELLDNKTDNEEQINLHKNGNKEEILTDNFVSINMNEKGQTPENNLFDNNQSNDIIAESIVLIEAKEIENLNSEYNLSSGDDGLVQDRDYSSIEKLCESVLTKSVENNEPDLSEKIKNLNEESLNEENNDDNGDDDELEHLRFDLINADEIEQFDFENGTVLIDNFDEENRNTAKEEPFNIINENKIYELNEENVIVPNIDSNNNLEPITEADDGIDEVIYDYNERGNDESYNQSECGENNNYDMEAYDEPIANEIQNNMQQYSLQAQENQIQNDNYSIYENAKDKNDSLLLQNNNLNFEADLKPGNINLDRQIDKMYDDFIKNRRESRIEKDYNRIVEKMNSSYDDDISSTTTNEIIEQIYFKDLSPSRYERLGSEESLSSNYSSLSQGSLGATRAKYKGISHARQIKSDRLRTRFGIAPAIGAFANFENADDTPVSYIPRKEYNWRKKFNLDDLDLDSNKNNGSKNENISIEAENRLETNENEKNINSKEKSVLKMQNNQGIFNESLDEEKVEGILNEKIDTMYDDVLKNRRKSRIEKEFQEIVEETEVKAEELNELDSVPTEKILKEILDSSDMVNNKESPKLAETEKSSKKLKSKKKIRKNSAISLSNENSDLLDQPKDDNPIENIGKERKKSRKNSASSFNIENPDLLDQSKNNDLVENVEKVKKKSRKNSVIDVVNETLQLIEEQSTNAVQNAEDTDKARKKKSSRKSSLIATDINAEEEVEAEIKTVKNTKKIKKRQSIDNSGTAQILDFCNNNDLTSYESYEVPENFSTPQKIGTPPNTPNESMNDDAEKYSNSSISNSSLSLVSSQVKLDRIGENDILELIAESSILGSSF